MEVLKGTIQKHEINIESTLITDGVPENHGEVSKFISGNDHIKHVIAHLCAGALQCACTPVSLWEDMLPVLIN